MNDLRSFCMTLYITRLKNKVEDPQTLADLGRLRPIQSFFQVIIGGRSAPPIVWSKIGSNFFVLENLLNYVLFVATVEVKLYFVAYQRAVDIASKSITKSVIHKWKVYGEIA